MYPYFQVSAKLRKISDLAEARVADKLKEIEATQRYNQQKMLAAFIQAGVSESHLRPAQGTATATAAAMCWTRSMPVPLGRRMLWCAGTLSAARTL